MSPAGALVSVVVDDNHQPRPTGWATRNPGEPRSSPGLVVQMVVQSSTAIHPKARCVNPRLPGSAKAPAPAVNHRSGVPIRLTSILAGILLLNTSTGHSSEHVHSRGDSGAGRGKSWTVRRLSTLTGATPPPSGRGSGPAPETRPYRSRCLRFRCSGRYPGCTPKSH